MLAPAIGFLDAGPNPCPVPDDTGRGLATIVWSTTAARRVLLARQPLGGPEEPVSEEAEGTLTLDDLTLGDQFTYRLYALDGKRRTLLDSLVLTTERDAGEAIATGTISLTPGVCAVARIEDTAVALVRWRTRYVRKALVTVQAEGDEEETEFATTAIGEAVFADVSPRHPHTFRLYDLSGEKRVLLATQTVVATVGTPFLAEPNPCYVAAANTTGVTTIIWVTPPSRQAEVTVQPRGGEETLFCDVAGGHLPFSDVRQGSWHTFRYYDTAVEPKSLLGTVVVSGRPFDRESLRLGTITASPQLSVPDRSGRPGSTLVQWSTQNLAAVEVTMQSGDDEMVLSNRPTGSQTVFDIRRDAIYVFRLYDASAPARRLLDAVTVVAL